VTDRKQEDLPTQVLPSGGCIIEKMVGKWGPYRYHVRRVGKKQIWTYLGKATELVTEKRVGKSENELVNREKVVR